MSNEADNSSNATGTFWDHLDELRSVLIRCVVAWGICAVAAFCFRDALFAFLFAPAHPDFITYRLLNSFVFERSGLSTFDFFEACDAALEMYLSSVRNDALTHPLDDGRQFV
jgi:Sec-independent protein secretion pathway component TatC